MRLVRLDPVLGRDAKKRPFDKLRVKPNFRKITRPGKKRERNADSRLSDFALGLFIALAVFVLALVPGRAQGGGSVVQKPLNAVMAAPLKGRRAGLIQAPSFTPDEAALVVFLLRNNWKQDSPPDYITFGEAFPAGALQPGDAIAARYGETVLAAQIDVKALHADGSVRHGAVTVAAPKIAAGQALQGAIIKTHTDARVKLDAAALIEDGYSFPVTLRFHYADETTGKFTADARALALDALKSGHADFWLEGPLAAELRVEKTAAPHLLLRFDIRVYRDGDIRTDVIFSNEKSFAPGRRESVYDVVIGPGEAPAFSAEKVGHHRSSTWRRTFWSGAQPRLFVAQNLEGLIGAGAALPLDPSLGVAVEVTARDDQALAGLAPLSPARVKQYFPATGGRSDIGLYPQWTATYLAAQTEMSARVMFANAEAAGAVPWHFIDDDDGGPVRIDRRPKFWADPRGLESRYAPDRPHPDLFASSSGGWAPDHSHKPALTFVPYLVTADRYYADELAMQAAWALFGRWPDLREGGLKAIDVEQVRASAWSLRDLSDAAFILPDDHPMKEYFRKALDQNFDAMIDKYITRRAMRGADEVEGYFEELIEREPERISPWQNDFVVIALWLEALRGEARATKLLRWTDNFQSGRFLSADFDPMRATSYALAAKEPRSQRPLGRWAEVAEKTYGGSGAKKPSMMEGYPEIVSGYVSSAYAALTAIASATGSLSAYEAFGFLARESRSYSLWDETAHGSVQENNRFLFRLSLPGGDTITRADIGGRKGVAGADALFGGNGADRMNGGGGGDLLYGFGGGDAMAGGAGGDLLFGGDGDDRLGGGEGEDILVGGPGDDVLTGGDGRDLFAYLRGNYGRDLITDFNPDEDVIGVSDYAPVNRAQAMPHIENIAAGAVLDMGQAGSIVFAGIARESLSPDNFRWIQ